MSVPPAASREPADVALLTGDRAGDLLAGALRAEGSRLVSWRVHTVHHRPGAGVTVGYTATVERPDSGGPPRRSEEYLCATTARLTRRPGPDLVRLGNGVEGPVVHLWRHPADPELPALAVACDPAALARRLGAPVAVELLAYRPTRRAVLRVRPAAGGVPTDGAPTGGGPACGAPAGGAPADGARGTGAALPARSGGDADGVAYLKVVRPATLATLADRHRILTAAGVPAPPLLRADEDGLVLLGAGHGTPLANLLAVGPGERTDAVLAALVATLDALPPAVLELPRRAAWAERAQHYAHAAATVLPAHADRIRAVARGVEELIDRADPGPVVPTHGDFYEANILMDSTPGAVAVTALLDVDAVGPGHRVDDLACLLGHVSVLPHLAPATYPRVPVVLDRWTRTCETLVDPVALHGRAAGVVLSLVAGARRTDGGRWLGDAEGRLARAERWLARGRELLAQRQPY
ncbi:aminoglycoside phosphotransferase family protein [Georgenia sp. TF02-10]|uniref:phosphotransferase family protein n=1 Tax=Georgenia sp. TF02-10 TaxID=2917725 RepID=UPI001FA6AE0A|nr:phosphotransferase [Georgenia sp. TF02-10]UNX54386.1 aminoglycoside phosphotransferase family protein [Georgenia sp. TF02-10]